MLNKQYMQFALQIAEGVKGQTSPNPPVGAVVVKNGRIIGFGAHLQSGTEHAEVIALQMAGDEAKGATLYVTLEPCCHEGKTPPCTKLIIAKQIQQVVIACEDKNSLVSGAGIKELQDAGISVVTDCLYERANELYRSFFYTIQEKLPYVTTKVAMSLDGKIATYKGESKWITSEASRRDSHLYRHQHDAILVGIQTILDDDPSLTSRIPNSKNPVRVVLDTNLRTPVHAKVITDQQADTWIFVGNSVSEERKREYAKFPSVRIVRMNSVRVQVKEVLLYLEEHKLSTVLVEGGGTVNDSFLRAGLINQLVIYQAPMIIGGKDSRSSFSGKGIAVLSDAFRLDVKKIERIGEDIKIIAYRKDEQDVHGNS